MEEHLFFRVPENWYVLITDIKGSTKAIEEGWHETINLLATGSIVAVLNRADKEGIQVPFFFGGDGASFILPPTLLGPVTHALLIHQENAWKNFGLRLRVGYVPVASILEKGHVLTLSKWKTSKLFTIPIIIGDGLDYAERIIKGPDYSLTPFPPIDEELDLNGMQCRWDRISPPGDTDEIVSLLVSATNHLQQAAVFKKIIDHLDVIYGSAERRKPISTGRLKFNSSLQKLALEMRARFGGMRPLRLVRNWITALFAPLYFRTRNGKSYLDQLVEMSDTLVIDGRINTVISGNATQRMALQAALNKMEEDGDIHYGFYVSKESIMSCYVRNLHENHIHFVDGAEGGYTRAAGMLKLKARQH